MFLPLITVLILSVMVGGSSAIECEDYSGTSRVRDVRNLGSPITDLDLDAGRLLLGHQDGGIRLLDVGADPAFPWALDLLDLAGSAPQVALTGTDAVVVTRSPATLIRLSLSGDLITSVGSPLVLPAQPVDLVMVGEWAYVLVEDVDDTPWTSTLVTVDLSDPGQPVISDQTGVPYPSVALDVHGPLLGVVCAGSPSLTLFDLTDPAVPAWTGTWHGGSLARDVLIRASKAWVTGNDKLMAIDLTDPSQPVASESWADPLGWVHIVDTGGPLLVLRETIQGGEDGGSLFGVSVAAGPVGSFRVHGEAAAASNGWAYVGEGQTLVSIEIRDGVEPLPGGVVPAESLDDDVRLIASMDDLGAALLETRDGGLSISRLWILDLPTDGVPVRRGSLDLPTGIVSLAMSDTVVAVGIYDAATGVGRVHMIHVGDRDQPVLLASIPVTGSPVVVAIRGEMLDVVTRSFNLENSHLYTPYVITNPEAPLRAPSLYLPEPPQAWAHDKIDDLVYIVGDGLFDIYDVSDPIYPVLVEDYITSFNFTSVVQDHNGEMRLGTDNGWLVRADRSSPGILLIRDAIWLPGIPRSLAVHGTTVWVACGDLALVDVALPSAPEIIGHVGAGDVGFLTLTPAGPVTASGAQGVMAWPGHCMDVAVWYLGMQTETAPREAVLRWNVAGVASVEDFRVSAGHDRQRDIRVAQDEQGFQARDSLARGEEFYTLELRTESAWVILEQISLWIPTIDIPLATDLGTPHPNPFNPRVKVSMALAVPGRVTVDVIDAAGRRVATLTDGSWPSGNHDIIWEGRDDLGRAVPSGTYFMRLMTVDGTRSRKMMLVR